MKCKKIVSGLLAGALVATSVFTGDMTTAKAAEMPAPIATYDFNDSTVGTATAYSAGLNGEATATFVAGRSEAETDKAVDTTEAGLKLAESNLGKNCTFSMWVKPTANIRNFGPILWFGEGEIGKWAALAGAYEDPEDESDSESYLIWGGNNTIVPELFYSMNLNEWTNLTCVQDGADITVYKNGESVGTITVADDVAIMDGENRVMYAGVNPYEADGTFPGVIDDITIYDSSLTAAQVRYLYDGKSAADIFGEEGFSASTSLSMAQGEDRVINVTLPELVSKDDAEISFKSEDTKIATVAADGTVTGIAIGTTKVTTTVKVGETTKTAETAIEVTSNEGIKQGIAVEYELSGNPSDGVLYDVSGRNNHATIVGPEGISFEDGVMTMSSNDSYIALPTSIMDSLTNKEKFTIETKFAKSKNCGNNAWLFCFGSKVKGTGTNYLFLSPHFEKKTLRAGIKNSGTEKLFATSTQPKVDQFYTVTMVFDEGDVKLYWDGIQVQGDKGNVLKSEFSIMNDVVTPGTENNILGYIGKSCFSADKNYQGKVASFKIHDRVLTDAEIQAPFQEIFAKNLDTVTKESILGDNTAADAVVYNLSLPSAVNEVPIKWTAEPDIISSTGIVKNGAEDQTVTLKASIQSGELKASKEFTVTVKALDKTALTAIIPEVEAAVAAGEYYTQNTKNALQKVLDKAAVVTNQTEVDALVKQAENVLANVEYDEAYVDPFTNIVCTENVELKPGATAKFLTIPAANMVNVTYTSSNPEIATVAADGTITGVARGYARITAKVVAKSDNFAMEYQTLVKVDEVKVVEQIVNVAGINIKGVTVAADAEAIAKDGAAKVVVTLPEDVKAANPAITYRAKGAVSVDANGIVTGKKGGKGTVIVKVKAGNKSITKKVVINVGEIKSASSVKVKKSITLKVKGLSGKVKWSVNNKKLAKITNKGKLTAKKKGKVTVTATVNGVQIKKTIKIKK